MNWKGKDVKQTGSSGDPWNRRVERRRCKEGDALAIEGVWRSSKEGLG